MKILLYTFVIVFIVASCTTEPQKDYAIIKGTITNKKMDSLQLSSLIRPFFRKKIGVDSEGVFMDTIKIEELDNFMIYDGGHLLYMYLEPGHDVTLTFDHKNIYETVNFTGKGAEINNYMFSKRKKEREMLEDTDNVYKLNESDFKLKQNEIQLASLELLENTKNLPSSYKEKEKRNIKYTYLRKLSNYESNHAYYTKTPDFKATEGFLKELDGLDYNNREDFMFSPSFNSLVSSHCEKEAKKIAETEGIEKDVALLKVYNTLTDQSIKNILFRKKAEYGITYTSSLDAYYAEVVKGCTDKEFLNGVNESYMALKKVAAGSPSPKFMDYENYNGGTTSLDDLKGKYIYIDVWATWCGPCKAEIPHLKKVESLYHDKNIEFVSISLDVTKHRDKWKKMVADKELGGIQLLADNAFKSQFIQDYYIKGIPRFILLDPEGNIVTANAPRPSEDQLKALLESLNL
ncbi:TlpA family protein disulfide reductase [Aestuariivivens insulae]|uniref:TlpA family protein disulfide reductase n=1 Tax=Aestuariivivens insulae TaxID=1621988 RepID=UPI001F587A80|nr:TlpA disulfide reductase family protein [Aestuariivivens insulae]